MSDQPIMVYSRFAATTTVCMYMLLPVMWYVSISPDCRAGKIERPAAHTTFHCNEFVKMVINRILSASLLECVCKYTAMHKTMYVSVTGQMVWWCGLSYISDLMNRTKTNKTVGVARNMFRRAILASFILFAFADHIVNTMCCCCCGGGVEGFFADMQHAAYWFFWPPINL